MSLRRSYKSDVSFLEKISMGATGTRRIFKHLEELGHRPLELERSSMSFKIWKAIKIKRIRVPDLLCVKCGKRVESRAKTRFEISMSHSVADPERAWDFGLHNDDFVAIVVCSRSGDRPIDWKPNSLVQYLSVSDLHTAQKKHMVLMTQPKGSQEGFERRILWPSGASSYDGVVTEVTNNRIQYRRATDGRIISLSLSRMNKTLKPLVKSGDHVVVDQALAAVVPVATTIPCEGEMGEEEYTRMLRSTSLSERYTGAKALGAVQDPRAVTALLERTKDEKEHVYVRLEAAASLARRNDERGHALIEDYLKDDYLQNRLEAIIVLGEINTERSASILQNALQDLEQHPEIRAGAAWALGEVRSKDALGALIACFEGVHEAVRIEAARALAKLAEKFKPEVADKFPGASNEQRAGIAWALGKSRNMTVDDLLKIMVDEDARQWVAYILGTQNEQDYVQEIEKLKNKDLEVYFATTVLWKIMSSWISNLEEY